MLGESVSTAKSKKGQFLVDGPRSVYILSLTLSWTRV